MNCSCLLKRGMMIAPFHDGLRNCADRNAKCLRLVSNLSIIVLGLTLMSSFALHAQLDGDDDCSISRRSSELRRSQCKTLAAC